MQEISSRKLKKTLLSKIQILPLADFLEFIEPFGAQPLINSLFSFICSNDEKVRWHAISAFGPTMKRLADQDMEKARIVMRRFMWMLNDESGGIGWGVPEAFGETLACDDRLAKEYCHILVSFTREDGFYLELAPLQRGLMWGIGRVAANNSAPLLTRNAVGYLLPYLHSPDLTVKALAARALGILKAKEAKDEIKALKSDDHELRIFDLGHMKTTTVANIAATAIKKIEGSDSILEHLMRTSIYTVIFTTLFCLLTANILRAQTVLFDQSHSQAFLIENSNELDLSELAETFRNEGFEVLSTSQPLNETNLTGLAGLVISGAFAPLQPEEITAVSNYIKNGGKVMLMLHIAHPLAPFMEELGVMHSNGVIREQQNNIDGQATDFTVAPTADHLLTADLKSFSLYGAWALAALSKDVRIIAATSPAAWVDLNKDGLLNQGDAMQSLGVAATGNIGSGSFVVFGDDAIFQNKFLITENKKLAINMAKWISTK